MAMQRAYLAASAARRCHQAHSADGIEVRPRNEIRHHSSAGLAPARSGPDVRFSRVASPSTPDRPCGPTLDRSRRLVLRDQARRKIEQALREHARAVGEFLRVSLHRDVVLHVLVRPAARMSDKRELRKDKPSSAKKPSIRPATIWMLSWPPTMMKPATLLQMSTRLAIGIGRVRFERALEGRP